MSAKMKPLVSKMALGSVVAPTLSLGAIEFSNR